MSNTEPISVNLKRWSQFGSEPSQECFQ